KCKPPSSTAPSRTNSPSPRLREPPPTLTLPRSPPRPSSPSNPRSPRSPNTRPASSGRCRIGCALSKKQSHATPVSGAPLQQLVSEQPAQDALGRALLI